MSESMIKGLILEIENLKFELTLDQAKKLKQQLCELFSEVAVPDIPQFLYKDFNPRPYRISWDDSSNDARFYPYHLDPYADMR